MDKRAAVRVPVRVRVQCRALDDVIDGLVEDVSRSGLFLRAARLVHAGSRLEIDLDLPGEETLRLSAQVVRVERAGMGVKFVGDRDDSRRPLANFIMRQHQTIR
jgi:uncharacterized protein (TIGR02266 family)